MPLDQYYRVLAFSCVFIAACASPSKKYELHKEYSVNTNVIVKDNSVKQLIESGYICENAYRYKDRSVGTGHCVSLIQICSGAPRTAMWRQGALVKGAELSPGTIIATFRSGKYPNITGWHAAIYISQDKDGIWVWDQWVGKPVHKRLIRFKNGNGKASNDGDAYSVVY